MTFDWVGWRTYGHVLAGVTEGRDDVDAVHVRYWGRGAWRALSAPVPSGHGWLGSEPRRLAVAAWRLRRWTQRQLDLSRFDVVHVAPHKYAAGLVAAVRDTGTPLSVVMDATTIQERGELTGLGTRETEQRYAPVLRAERAVVRAADLIVAMSGWAADGVRAHHGVSEDRIEVLPPCIPAPSSGPAPRGADVLDRPVRLVFVGNDWDRKGGPRLLAWHQRRWAEVAELHVCSSHAPVDRRARNVVWHGSVPHDQLIGELLPTMDVLILPTTNDMSPHAVVEAASLGLPVVSSAIGGLGDLVCSGETGFLLPPNDEAGFVHAVEELIGSPELRRRTGRAASELFRQRLDARVVGGRLLDRLVALAADR